MLLMSFVDVHIQNTIQFDPVCGRALPCVGAILCLVFIALYVRDSLHACNMEGTTRKRPHNVLYLNAKMKVLVDVKHASHIQVT